MGASKRGANCATISGYFIVTGTFCCLNDFQYNLLNWYTCVSNSKAILSSSKASSSGLEILILIGKGYPSVAGYLSSSLYRALLKSKNFLQS